MHQIEQLDRQLFLWLNELRTPWLDPVFFWISERESWFWLYALMLIAFILIFRKRGIIFIMGLALTVTLSDQITSSIMKPGFARLRPSHDIELKDRVHVINNYRGGTYGFASGHAANSFSVALFVYLALHHVFPFTWWLFIWAGVVSYSRIYLGVHYPLDILAGAAVGCLAAWLMYSLSLFADRKIPGKKATAYAPEFQDTPAKSRSHLSK